MNDSVEYELEAEINKPEQKPTTIPTTTTKIPEIQTVSPKTIQTEPIKFNPPSMKLSFRFTPMVHNMHNFPFRRRSFPFRRSFQRSFPFSFPF